MPNPLHEIMPQVFRHIEIWEGSYGHIDIAGQTLDLHTSRVKCIFPSQEK